MAPQVKGHTFAITGAGQPSVGSSMAITLARASPPHILIVSRTATRAEPVLAAIRETYPSVKATFAQVDLSDHDSVWWAAKEIIDATVSKVDVLINSAGNMALKEYTVDKQGIETQLSANHVGHFLLSTSLHQPFWPRPTPTRSTAPASSTLPAWDISSAPSISTTTGLSGGKTYDLWSGYSQSKTANILFSFGLAQRLKERGVASFAARPGSNLDTQLGSHLGTEDYNSMFETTKRNTGKDFVFDALRFETYAQIGGTPLAAALDPQVVPKSPAPLINSQIAETAEHASSPEVPEKLWKLSEKLVGQEVRYEILLNPNFRLGMEGAISDCLQEGEAM